MARVRDELNQASPELAALVSVLPVSYDDLVAVLAPGEAGLIYQRAGDVVHSFAFDERFIARATCDAGEVQALVRDMRNEVKRPGSDEYREAAERLYDLLVRPFDRRLAGQPLLVVPSGALSYVPFAALHDGRDFLVSSHVLRVSPSLAALGGLPAPQAPEMSNHYLVMANPRRVDPKVEYVVAEAEARAVLEQYPQATLLANSDASAEAFYRLADDQQLIHLAAPGELRPDEPFSSRLLLAPTSDSNGDITVEDLFGLSLQARLVVLSGFETDPDRGVTGDELVGLYRGLFYAGAEGVVGTLWRVGDESTALVMRELYRQIRQGQPAATALQRAQIAAMEDFPHPYFWSSFQYAGLEFRPVVSG